MRFKSKSKYPFQQFTGTKLANKQDKIKKKKKWRFKKNVGLLKIYIYFLLFLLVCFVVVLFVIYFIFH